MLRGWLLAVGLLAAPASTHAICLRVEAGSGLVAMVPASAGEEVRLGFRHSIYGSQVEEQFHVTGEGLHLVRLRYAEPRLVEFYGYEGGERADGWWVIEVDRLVLPSLTVRVSPGSSMEIGVGTTRIPLWGWVEPGGAVRLTATECAGRSDGR